MLRDEARVLVLHEAVIVLVEFEVSSPGFKK
jgi:hypothetical protein